MLSTSSEQYTDRPPRRVRMTPPRRSIRRCQEMRGWLMWRYSARSLTFTSPAVARRSRMRRRVGLAKARKWSGSSFRGLWRNIKVPLSNITHKGCVMCWAPALADRDRERRCLVEAVQARAAEIAVRQAEDELEGAVRGGRAGDDDKAIDRVDGSSESWWQRSLHDHDRRHARTA